MHERQVRVRVQQREGPERSVHAEHQELAVREVHHAHDAENQRQPDRDEGVDPAEQDRRDDELGDRGVLTRVIYAGPTARAAPIWRGCS